MYRPSEADYPLVPPNTSGLAHWLLSPHGDVGHRTVSHGSWQAV